MPYPGSLADFGPRRRQRRIRVQNSPWRLPRLTSVPDAYSFPSTEKDGDDRCQRLGRHL